MRRTDAGLALAAGLAWLQSACAPSPAPHGWLPDAEMAQQDTYGGWLLIKDLVHDEWKLGVEGELIAISADSVFVMTQAAVLESRAIAGVQRATLTTYDANAKMLAIWTIVGTLSTLSHGGFFVVSVPVWAITGVATARSTEKKAQVALPDRSWDDMRMYARFPQGIPEGLDRATLHPKPKPQ